ncbi:peptidase M50 [Methylogaea oryzae]|uniref:Peptidase M50 n=2 Tax=Methylogaea oryzae TaxID=1295382 RepID=A0A8D5AHJ0_9GAMM|nr:peptidase M50 [Methylogaea oryzae]
MALGFDLAAAAAGGRPPNTALRFGYNAAMEELNLIQKIAIWALPVLFAVTLHEVAHGWVAKLCGDDTARRMGRLSLNPLHHVDPVGTLLVPGFLLLLGSFLPGGGFIFGWAKPVPVSWNRLRNTRRDVALVAVAGPVANLLMALLWAMAIRLAVWIHVDFITGPLAYMGVAGIAINVVLAALNLLPLPPLDGGRIMTSLLPPRLAYKYAQIEPYGFYILLALVATNLLSYLLAVPVTLLQGLFIAIAGV